MSQAAIVTGVSRGLGAALGRELLERGFTVLGLGRASDPALGGDRYRFVRFDLADSAEIDSALGPAFEELKQNGPESVCLVNNAATVEPVGALGRLASRDIAHALTVNLTAAAGLANLFCRVFDDPSVELFQASSAKVVPPGVVAAKIVSRLLVEDVEHGRTYSYQEL